MKPLEIRATVPGHLSLPWGYVHFDGVVAAEVAARRGLPPLGVDDDLTPIEIPIAREPGDRFYLASASILQWEEMTVLYRQRRFPVAEALARHGKEFRRIDTTVGRQKNTRIPVEAGYVVDQRVTFYAIADPEPLRDLLSTVRLLGSQRGSGKGEVTRWEVVDIEPWEGFPVVREGRALRHLPPDWPGVIEADRRRSRLTPPYWWPKDKGEVLAPLPPAWEVG